MKKFLSILVVVTVVVGIIACYAIKSADNSRTVEAAELSIDIGHSEIFSDAELREAVDVIKSDFDKTNGSQIASIRFAGDESIKDGKAVFLMDFHQTKAGHGAFEEGKDYTDYQWTLSHGDNGWTVEDQHIEVLTGTDLL